MKHSLTVAFLFSLAALAALAVRGQGSDARVASVPAAPAAPPTVANAAAPSVEGNLLVAQAAREVSQLPALEAKLRIQTNMLGQELIGSGSYYQLARSPETLFKLELKLQVAHQVSSLLHVSDGRFVWTRRDLPTHKFLGRVDQRRIAEALADSSKLPIGASPSNMLALGGLGRLLETLSGHFDFAPPREESFGGVSVWVVEGQWRPDVLAHLWPEKAQLLQTRQNININELPAQLPSHVVVVLSRDSALRLFPYRIDYQRQNGAGESVSLVSIDLFDVRRNVSLDPRLFSYNPGDQEVVDHTEEFLRSLGAG